jgi:hypothetical protein
VEEAIVEGAFEEEFGDFLRGDDVNYEYHLHGYDNYDGYDKFHYSHDDSDDLDDFEMLDLMEGITTDKDNEEDDREDDMEDDMDDMDHDHDKEDELHESREVEMDTKDEEKMDFMFEEDEACDRSCKRDNNGKQGSVDKDADKGRYIDLSHALVRHKRLSLDSIRQRRQQVVTYDLSGGDDFYHSVLSDNYDGDFYGLDEWRNDPEELTEPNQKKKQASQQPKQKSLKNYTTQRQIVLIQNATKLKNFCDNLSWSVQKYAKAHADDPNASAVGLDVEYCSLELDIRRTLPAMLQLAGPGPEAPVGLIWLDRFPDHGRKLLHDPEYKPLMQLLADSSILKVGVGVSSDVGHLAKWWGVDDGDHVPYFFGGVTDLEVGNDASLADLCQSVLGKKLPKSKQKLTKKQKKRRKEGKSTPTAHWRAKSITKEMKEYAANDASCAVDVWVKLKGLAGE